MLFNGKNQRLVVFLAGLSSSAVFAGTMGPIGSPYSYIPSITVQGGGFWASQGQNQHI
jgi:hypothetical protein